MRHERKQKTTKAIPQITLWTRKISWGATGIGSAKNLVGGRGGGGGGVLFMHLVQCLAVGRTTVTGHQDCGHVVLWFKGSVTGIQLCLCVQ